MADTLTISLGGKSFEIHRLTLRQMRDLQICSANTINVPKDDLAARIAFSYQSDVEIVRAGLSRSQPDITAEAILDMESTREELGDASIAILRFSGLLPPGEDQAPAIPPSAE
jgi:hypothetical protein